VSFSNFKERKLAGGQCVRAAEGGACIFRTLSKFNLWERSARATPFCTIM
jgi:hypothetical protein